jgi:signal transduction histidine kinase
MRQDRPDTSHTNVGICLALAGFTREPSASGVAVLLLAAVSLAVAVLLLHRLRVRQVIALERIRRQIAIDLHDEVGSGLVQIAIRSEVARRDAPPDMAEVLAESAAQARALRDTMADIVWAIDPRRDRLVDLVQRMRSTAHALASDGTEVAFDAPAAAAVENIGLDPDARRQIYLVFKEALANVQRHAQARRVDVCVGASAGELRLEIHDDGRGFDPAIPSEGTGLKSLHERAARAGGHVIVSATPGRGTSVCLVVPRRRR